MSRLTVVSLLLLAAFGCGVTETGNPELQVSFEGRSTSPAVDLDSPLRTAAPPIRVDEAWVNVGSVRWVEAEACDTAGEVEHAVAGPFLVDLTGAPLVTTGAVPATDYCRVRIDLERVDALDEAAPGALLDNAIFVAGALADGTPFEIRSRFQDDLDLRSRGAPIPVGDGAAVVVGFDVGRWLADLPLATATPVGGVILVDEDHEEALLEAFEANVEAAAELFDDGDDDGHADDDDELLAD